MGRLMAVLGTHATGTPESAAGTWLHLATRRRNQRIFRDKSVLDIVRTVLADMVESQPGIGERPLHPDEGDHHEEIADFWHWRPVWRITTCAITVTDCNSKHPNAAMARRPTGLPHHSDCGAMNDP